MSEQSDNITFLLSVFILLILHHDDDINTDFFIPYVVFIQLAQ